MQDATNKLRTVPSDRLMPLPLRTEHPLMNCAMQDGVLVYWFRVGT
jgi:hypothetical protein